ncbi:MAG: DEAD/DEAH box helicase [Desulfobacterales bacterium]|nr:DEAD/DEAH box helicase [Desulfobacterales bacterium]
MLPLTRDLIRHDVADSYLIYKRGLRLYENGAFILQAQDFDAGRFDYQVDGSYGDYITRVDLGGQALSTQCSCPYPGSGCKHTVAVLLYTKDLLEAQAARQAPPAPAEEAFLSSAEIRAQALDDRKSRARSEHFRITAGDMLKGCHLLETESGGHYTVTLHDPDKGVGHCTCPDYLTNRLGTCKHLICLTQHLRRRKDFAERLAQERFPFVDLYWDSADAAPRLYSELPKRQTSALGRALAPCFDDRGAYTGEGLAPLLDVLPQLDGNKQVRVQEAVLAALEREAERRQLVEQAEAGAKSPPPAADLRVRLYPYQEEGVRFGLYRDAALIGDEMGLGKTLQAIALAALKKEVFGFSKVLVVTMASLKEQWRREIERFSAEKAVVVSGTPKQRWETYLNDPAYFKITNYEAVLRDVPTIERFKPDLVILDEAQRIKNFSTKTADAVKRLPRRHALVLTGTPLENKLEDVYSIVQFLDPQLLSPLWRFAAEHFMLSRSARNKIIGYRNLDRLHQRLQGLVIRRRKEEVLKDLPEQVENNYYIDLHQQQREMHAGYAQALMPLLHKKFLTPVDLRRMQELLLRMRQACNATYLIDRKTNISPKLDELRGIIDELVVQNKRKMVIFSEWTTMTYLIGRHLSDAGIPFVELSGKVPVQKRQALIDEFSHNPECRVFLSTDAGGTGLNLQAADCVVNFELPWNPARLNQRIGRVNRIGQKSRCINVVNLIAKESIEEKILAGIQLKTDLFKGVFEGGADEVTFTREKRTELINRLREMMGDELAAPSAAAQAEEIPEDTPHFLNPEALRKAAGALDVTGEEAPPEPAPAAQSAEDPARGDGGAHILAAQPPEKIEAVLNTGMLFIGGLLEMATGQKMTATAADGRMVQIDRETGEVTLKFRLPGF